MIQNKCNIKIIDFQSQFCQVKQKSVKTLNKSGTFLNARIVNGILNAIYLFSKLTARIVDG